MEGIKYCVPRMRQTKENGRNDGWLPVFKLIKKLLTRRKMDPWRDQPDVSQMQQQARKSELGPDLEANLRGLRQASGPSYDLSVRRFLTGRKVASALIYLEGLTDSRTVEEILRTLMLDTLKNRLPDGQISRAAVEKLLTVKEVREAANQADLFSGLARGDAALLFEGSAPALLCNASGWQTRSITEPDAELTVRGPREGFVESLRINTSLIRRRIRIPQLWIESVTVGELSQTEVAFAYIEGLAREKLVSEVRSRLKRIKIDAILESGYIEDFIADTPFSLFPLTYRTERPDKVAASLLEGRVAIFTDGTPQVLLVPTELQMLVQAPDDYYEPPPIGSFIRILRHAALLMSMLLPGFYVAVINFHPELLPTDLLLRITAAREGVPFPVIVEMLLMEVLFEILREAGIRLPAAIGPAISIVGALILGDAAIRAGLVSPAVVIVVALTAIASFSTPIFSLAISFRIIRFIYTILGATFGLFGLQFGLLVSVVHLCSLRSFGIPYMMPLGPLVLQDLKDVFIRTWWWGMRTRPKLLGGREPQRQEPGQMPRPGKDPREPEGEV
jgi:spore germination protein KA